MALPSLWRRSREDDPSLMRREDDPFVALRRDVARLFEDLWHGFDMPMAFRDGWSFFEPRVDVEETDEDVRITAELPGVDAKDLDVQLTDGTLVLRGEKREERGDRGRGWWERTYGAFERTIPLPCEVEVERASAKLEHGVLRVRLPKSEAARAHTRRIPVTAA